MAAEYDIAALKASLVQQLGDEAAIYPVRIEQRFPRILARIVDLWGTSACDNYLQSLMVSDRTDRQGFPADVATEIFRLSMAHGALGLSSQTSASGWAGLDDGELYKKSINRKDNGR